MSKKPTSDAMEIIEGMIGDDAETRELYEQAKVNVHVAQLIYDARTEAGLSQTELARMVGPSYMHSIGLIYAQQGNY